MTKPRGYLGRLCLSCFESWTGTDEPWCLACEMEWQRQYSRQDDGILNTETTSWWGPSIDDVNPEDLADGFFVASVTGKDAPMSEMNDYS